MKLQSAADESCSGASMAATRALYDPSWVDERRASYAAQQSKDHNNQKIQTIDYDEFNSGLGGWLFRNAAGG